MRPWTVIMPWYLTVLPLTGPWCDPGPKPDPGAGRVCSWGRVRGVRGPLFATVGPGSWHAPGGACALS